LIHNKSLDSHFKVRGSPDMIKTLGLISIVLASILPIDAAQAQPPAQAPNTCPCPQWIWIPISPAVPQATTAAQTPQTNETELLKELDGATAQFFESADGTQKELGKQLKNGQIYLKINKNGSVAWDKAPAGWVADYNKGFVKKQINERNKRDAATKQQHHSSKKPGTPQ
jgi:hypothetical protein